MPGHTIRRDTAQRHANDYDYQDGLTQENFPGHRSGQILPPQFLWEFMPLDYSKWDALHDDGDESPAPVRSELKSATELAPRDLQLLSLFMVRDTAQPSTSGKRV